MSILPLNFFTKNIELLFNTETIFDFENSNNIVGQFNTIIQILYHLNTDIDVENPITNEAMIQLEKMLNQLSEVSYPKSSLYQFNNYYRQMDFLSCETIRNCTNAYEMKLEKSNSSSDLGIFHFI